MNLEEKVMTELKAAMKAKDQAALRTLRAIKSAILLVKTDGSGKALDADGELKLIQKLAKQRQESMEIYLKQGREDLAKTEEEELAVLQNFLPEQLSDDKLRQIIQNIINTTGASSMKDMGKVMGMANGEVAGRADGKTIAELVKSMLSA